MCRDLTFLLMSRRKLRVAALGVLSPELQALRNERAVAAKREVPKPERIRYKNIRVARVTCSVANRAHCFAHDSGGVSSDGVGASAESCTSFQALGGLGGVDCSLSSFDERNDLASACEAVP